MSNDGIDVSPVDTGNPQTEVAKSESEFVNEETLKKILNTYRSKLPSAVITELYESLKTMDLTEEEVVSIANEVVNKYVHGSREELEHILMRLQRSDMLLKNITEKIEMIAKALEERKEEKSVNPSGRQEEINLKVDAVQTKPNEGISSGSQKIEGVPNVFIMDNRSQAKKSFEEPMEKVDFESKAAKIREYSKEKEEKKEDATEEEEYRKPLLSAIRKDPFSMAVLMRWIEFLLKKVGNERLSDVLDYYLDIGWISEEVVLQILTYAKGMEVQAEKGASRKLAPEDHFKTLLFIEKLRGTPIDRLTLTKMERELSLLSQKSEDYEDIYGL